MIVGSYDGARAKGSWTEEQWSVGLDAAYLEYETYNYETDEFELHQVFGLAVDAAYVWELPSSIGYAYGGLRSGFR